MGDDRYSAIPAELKGRAQWVAFKLEKRAGKTTKVPYQPRDPRLKASSTDAATWASFEDACQAIACDPNHLDGIGFVFTTDDPYVGVDFDHCRDPETGTIEADVRRYIEMLGSYTEVSPSGAGLHVIVRGELPPGGRRKGNIEMYQEGRYFTMTGQHLDGTPTTIEGRSEQIDAMHSQVFRTAAVCPDVMRMPAPLQTTSSADRLRDDEILAKARRARNGSRFDRLWNGDFSGYPSQSEADIALCSMLGFFSGPDGKDQVDRLFRQSALYRPEKWDESHTGDGRTYGQMTVGKALYEKRDFYARGHNEYPRDDDADSKASLAWLRAQPIFQRVGIAGARKLGKSKATFIIDTDYGISIALGSSADVLDFRKVRAAIADAIPGVVVIKANKDPWEPYAEAIFALAGEGIDTRSDPTSELLEWIADLLLQNDDEERLIDLSNAESLCALILRLNSPLNNSAMYDRNGYASAFGRTTDGRLVIRAKKFVQFVTMQFGQRTSLHEVTTRLGALGFESKQLSARNSELPRTEKVRVFISPAGFEVQ